MLYFLVLITGFVAYGMAQDLLFVSSLDCASCASTELSEAQLDYTYDEVTPEEFLTLSTTQFASYKAIIIASPGNDDVKGPTADTDSSDIAFLEDSMLAWSPAITGNIMVIGTDPSSATAHNAGASQLIMAGLAYVTSATTADGSPKTGLYLALSNYYASRDSSTVVKALEAFGDIKVTGRGVSNSPSVCFDIAHINHTADGSTQLLTSSATKQTLSNWPCSANEIFASYPTSGFLSTFEPLISVTQSRNISGNAGPSVLTRAQTTCGDGHIDSGEQCDDGNVTDGDGCSVLCQCELGLVADQIKGCVLAHSTTPTITTTLIAMNTSSRVQSLASSSYNHDTFSQLTTSPNATLSNRPSTTPTTVTSYIIATNTTSIQYSSTFDSSTSRPPSVTTIQPIASTRLSSPDLFATSIYSPTRFIQSRDYNSSADSKATLRTKSSSLSNNAASLSDMTTRLDPSESLYSSIPVALSSYSDYYLTVTSKRSQSTSITDLKYETSNMQRLSHPAASSTDDVNKLSSSRFTVTKLKTFNSLSTLTSSYVESTLPTPAVLNSGTDQIKKVRPTPVILRGSSIDIAMMTAVSMSHVTLAPHSLLLSPVGSTSVDKPGHDPASMRTLMSTLTSTSYHCKADTAHCSAYVIITTVVDLYTINCPISITQTLLSHTHTSKVLPAQSTYTTEAVVVQDTIVDWHTRSHQDNSESVTSASSHSHESPALIGYEIVVFIIYMKVVDNDPGKSGIRSEFTSKRRPIYNTIGTVYPCYVCQLVSQGISWSSTDLMTAITTVYTGSLQPSVNPLPTIQVCVSCTPVVLRAAPSCDQNLYAPGYLATIPAVNIPVDYSSWTFHRSTTYLATPTVGQKLSKGFASVTKNLPATAVMQHSTSNLASQSIRTQNHPPSPLSTRDDWRRPSDVAFATKNLTNVVQDTMLEKAMKTGGAVSALIDLQLSLIVLLATAAFLFL